MNMFLCVCVFLATKCLNTQGELMLGDQVDEYFVCLFFLLFVECVVLMHKGVTTTSARGQSEERLYHFGEFLRCHFLSFFAILSSSTIRGIYVT